MHERGDQGGGAGGADQRDGSTDVFREGSTPLCGTTRKRGTSFQLHVFEPNFLSGCACDAAHSLESQDGGAGRGGATVAAGVTPAGHTCDLGLSAFADDVAKKIVGRSEKELFEALKHSDEVLDEELARGGWKRNVDKREVVPVGNGQGIVAGARHLGGRFTWNGNNREELLCRKRAVRTAWLSMGRFWTVKGHWATKRIIFGCKVLGAAVAAAETYAWHESEMQEI